MRRFLATVAGTALAAYFLDPDQGNRRRKMAVDRAGALLRRASRESERAVAVGRAYAGGMAQKVRHAITPGSPPADDQALADRVRTELFRPQDAPKGRINVDAVDGVVTLRGELERREQIADVERRVRSITGVRDVENLLHTAGTRAPNVQA